MRPKSTRESFEHKVKLLENWIGQSRYIPDDVPIIAGITDLQKWADPSYGAKIWVSFSVASPNGQNPDLRRRFDAALPQVIELQARRSDNPDTYIAELEARISELELVLGALSGQNERLLAQISKLTDDLRESRAEPEIVK